NQQDYGMRIYDNRLGRFLSVDPLSSKYADLTTYQFASNTPLQAIDLDGLEAFFVHGTTNFDFVGVNFNTGAYFFEKADKVVQELPKLFGNSTSDIDFEWSGDNSNEARQQAGIQLAAYILQHRVPGEPVTIVGHSHGGNVAIEAVNFLVTNKLIRPSEVNIIAMNTPDRKEQVLEKNSPVKFYTINAIGDVIQNLGSNWDDLKNGPVPNNADKDIFFKDQHDGGGCGYSEHCPSNKNFEVWFPKLEKAKAEVEKPK
ncbi:MAG: hypothetical protein IPI93_06185, partial [Sphingobacteriaceae bacterium]|nr:hypothetical protein [Sphingobacteriaceae bacterium]